MTWKPIDTADKTLTVGTRSKVIVGCDAKGVINETFWTNMDGGHWLMCGSNVEHLYTWEPILWVELPEPCKQALIAKGARV